MKKTLLFILIFVLLTACTPQAQPTKGGVYPTATPLTTPLPLPAAGADVPAQELAFAPTQAQTPATALPGLVDGEALRQRMLFSHATWKTAWADGWVVFYPGDGSTNPSQVTHTQIWLEQPAKARVLSGDQAQPHSLWLSDGLASRTNNEPVQALPPGLDAFYPPQALSDSITPYPLAGMLGSPLSDMLFPTALAQRGGEFTLLGEEEMAGRKVVTALWRRTPGGQVVDRFWVDAATGILLRWINYSKPGGEAISIEMYFSALTLDTPIPQQTFALGQAMPGAFAAGAQDLPNP